MALFEVVCIHGRAVYRSRERAEAEAQACVAVQVPAGVAAESEQPVVNRITNRD